MLDIKFVRENKDIVKEKGYIACKAMQDALVLPTPKHFPGHGNTNVDSHVGLPVVKDSFNSIHNTELVPFKYVIDKGVDGIMVSHILYEQIDNEYPSTLSKKVINDLLINELGFKGLVITDSLTMSAIWGHYSIHDAYIDLVKKGKIKE